MSKTHKLYQFIQRVWNEGDINAIPEFIANTYTIYHDPGDPWEGQTLDVEGFKNRVSVSRAPVPDQMFDIKNAYENKDSVCITWLWRGTHKGEIAGFSASGKELTMSGATVYNFVDEAISGHWQIADRMSIFQQLQRNAE